MTKGVTESFLDSLKELLGHETIYIDPSLGDKDHTVYVINVAHLPNAKEQAALLTQRLRKAFDENQDLFEAEFLIGEAKREEEWPVKKLMGENYGEDFQPQFHARPMRSIDMFEATDNTVRIKLDDAHTHHFVLSVFENEIEELASVISAQNKPGRRI